MLWTKLPMDWEAFWEVGGHECPENNLGAYIFSGKKTFVDKEKGIDVIRDPVAFDDWEDFVHRIKASDFSPGNDNNWYYTDGVIIRKE